MAKTELDIPGTTIKAPTKVPVPWRTVIQTKFALGDRVTIDNDMSILAVVLGFAYYGNAIQVSVGWFANGDAKEAWINETRLSLVSRHF